LKEETGAEMAKQVAQIKILYTNASYKVFKEDLILKTLK
jgi:hypothetical protein